MEKKIDSSSQEINMIHTRSFNPAQVFILTGFFGSGKTTLVKYITSSPNILSKHIAVIQNEFSPEMGIEKDTLVDGDGKNLGNLFEMPSGCMCCVVRDNTILFLQKLVKVKPEIKYILIECHGTAEVSDIIKTFWVDEELELGLVLGKVICVTDACNYLKNLNEYDEIFNHQIVCCDTLILNKIDLIRNKSNDNIGGNWGLIDIKEDVLLKNPLVNILETNYCMVDLDELLNKSSYSNNISKYSNIEKLEYNSLKNNSDCKDCVDNLDNSKHKHNHDENSNTNCSMNKNHFVDKHNIQNLIIKISESELIQYKKHNLISKSTLDRAFGSLLWELTEDKEDLKIIRMKGLFKEKENNNIINYSIQGIYDVYEILEIISIFENKENNNDNKNDLILKLLIIGKNIKKYEKEIREVIIGGINQ